MDSSVRTDVVITDFLQDEDSDAVLQFLTQWVTGDVSAAQEHVADHSAGTGTTLVARLDGRLVGIVTLRWVSNNPAFADFDIPLIQQIAVAPAFQRSGIATALMETVEQLAAGRGKRTMGITVGLFEEYGPAQRLYAKRGYLPDGRGVCLGPTPLRQGQSVEIDHDVILWLTKEL